MAGQRNVLKQQRQEQILTIDLIQAKSRPATAEYPNEV
jgi:hypothetical protein